MVGEISCNHSSIFGVITGGEYYANSGLFLEIEGNIANCFSSMYLQETCRLNVESKTEQILHYLQYIGFAVQQR